MARLPRRTPLMCAIGASPVEAAAYSALVCPSSGISAISIVLTIRRLVLKFGPVITATFRSPRDGPSGIRHLDEVFVRVAGERAYLWRAVDNDGEVLEVLAQSRRNKRAALRLM